MKTKLVSTLFAAGLSLLAAQVMAAWPERTVKFIVPFPAGGPADGAMRIVGKRLGEIWGQPVVVENKAGAPGMVSVASAPVDGYTLLLGAGSNIVTSPLINKQLAYKRSDFAPISLLVTSSSILTVHPGVPAKNIKEFIGLAKASKTELTYGSSGIGSPGHLTVELFEQLTGAKLLHIPFKGGTPLVADLVAGHIHMAVNATPSVIQHVQAGKLVPLAVLSRQRDRSLPNVPTMTESGVPNLEFDVWYGIFGPAKLAPDIIEKISTDIRKVLAEPEVEKAIQAQGNESAGTTPQQLVRMITEEARVWEKLIADRKLSVDN